VGCFEFGSGTYGRLCGGSQEASTTSGVNLRRQHWHCVYLPVMADVLSAKAWSRDRTECASARTGTHL
jgi:Uri superfamily endonuclease